VTGKGDRTHPDTAYDKTRGNVALAKLATALGVRLDASAPDHVLLEQLAEAAQFVTLERPTKPYTREGWLGK
jgi:hypothetical protein